MGDDILSRIVSWAAREGPVRALVLEGSRAEKGQVDELADYDVNMFITDPEPYAQDDRWLSAIADVWVYIPEKVTYHGQVFASRLVIYRAGVKVDFILYSTDVLQEFARSDPLPEHYDLGYRVLLDKDGVAAAMPPSSFLAFRRGKPTETTFLACVHEFWFEAYHVAKYLRRRDLWPVKGRDWATKRLLLRMIEWHERGQHGWDYRTHPLGKHMESWVAAETWARLARVFAHFGAEESWEAMFATCELFGRVARETAQSLGCRYPAEIEERIVTFARQLRKEAAQSGAGADAHWRAAQLSRSAVEPASQKRRVTVGQEQLIGTWKLIAHETRRANGEVTYPLGRDFVGLLMYDTHGYCAVQIIRRDRLPFRSEDLQQGTPEEIKAAFEGYFAYFGTYEVNAEASTVTHHVECALFPNWVGTELTRVFELTGSRLMLKSSPYVVAGEQIVGVAIWERVISGAHRSEVVPCSLGGEVADRV